MKISKNWFLLEKTSFARAACGRELNFKLIENCNVVPYELKASWIYFGLKVNFR